MLFPKMGIFNTTILELILHAVTAFTYWNFDSLQKRQGQRSEANMERPTGHFEKGVKLQCWQDKLRTSLLLKKKKMQKQVEIKQGHCVTELKPNFKLSHMTRFTNNNNKEFPITQIIHLTDRQTQENTLLYYFFKVHLESQTLCCCCSVTKLCLTLCDPMDCSTPGFTVLHHLPELAQTHVH